MTNQNVGPTDVDPRIKGVIRRPRQSLGYYAIRNVSLSSYYKKITQKSDFFCPKERNSSMCSFCIDIGLILNSMLL